MADTTLTKRSRIVRLSEYWDYSQTVIANAKSMQGRPVFI